MKVLDLFSGGGGLSYGLEKAGMETIAFCENDSDCHVILSKHWPKTPIFTDIKELKAHRTDFGEILHLENGMPINLATSYDGEIDLICGGYPCTGHSVAGKKDGFKNEKSALWGEYFRIIGEVRPKYCIIENSHNLRSTGLVEVLRDIGKIGYNAEWSVISAYSVGAPHQRERIYIVLWRADVPYCDPFRPWQSVSEKEKTSCGWWSMRRFKRSPLFGKIGSFEPKILRNVDGLSKGLLRAEEEKIKQIGNAVVPQIAELIGKQLMKHERERA